MPVSTIRTSSIYSLAVISFLKTSTCAHIYLSPSLQSILHVFTVSQLISSQWSLFLKLQPALIYIYPRLYNRVLHVFTVSQWSLFLKLQPALIYIYPHLYNRVLHVFTVSQWSLFLKLQTALIYIYPRLYNRVLHVFTVSQWSLFLKLQPRAHIYLSPSLQSGTSRIYCLAVISFLKT